MKSLILKVSFAIFACTAAGAHAQPIVAAPQVAVSYGDLDLSREAGASVMLARLHVAASKVCGGRPDMQRIDLQSAYRTCTDRAMSEAVGRLASPTVTMLYDGRYSRVAQNR